MLCCRVSGHCFLNNCFDGCVKKVILEIEMLLSPYKKSHDNDVESIYEFKSVETYRIAPLFNGNIGTRKIRAEDSSQ